MFAAPRHVLPAGSTEGTEGETAADQAASAPSGMSSEAEERWKRMAYPAGRILHLVPACLRAPFSMYRAWQAACVQIPDSCADTSLEFAGPDAEGLQRRAAPGINSGCTAEAPVGGQAEAGGSGASGSGAGAAQQSMLRTRGNARTPHDQVPQDMWRYAWLCLARSVDTSLALVMQARP